MSARVIMKLRVTDIREETTGVRLIELRHPLRDRLPFGNAGSHVDLRLPDGKIRQYSLCGDPGDQGRYLIAVKREKSGRGGSEWVHEKLNIGSEVHVSAPRNNFGLSPTASHHILVAGGIGITPFISMIFELMARNENFTMHYSSRLQKPPFLKKLQALCGDRLKLYVTRSEDKEVKRFDAADTFKLVQAGAHVYCCGPLGLTDGVRDATAHWPEEQVHFEIFQAALDENFNPEPFDVHIASTGQTFRIPADKSALNVLREEGFILPSSCELGVCGSCECGFSNGTVIHRDSILSTSARQDRMMLCVSRARVEVTLDL